MEGMIFAFNDDGTLREYKEPYATVDYTTKEDFEFIKKAVEFYKKMQWISAENPPEVDEEGYSDNHPHRQQRQEDALEDIHKRLGVHPALSFDFFRCIDVAQ